MPFVGSSTLKVGALVEPLTAQMADYLGVQNGLMVKQVARKSQAAAAGMKAFDVIVKVGPENIATVSDWDRAMRANQGKTVAVTVLRDKKQQTLTLLVDSKKKGEVEFDELFPDENCPLMAFADADVARDLLGEMAQGMAADALAADEFRKQAEQFRDAFKDQNFGIDSKQMDELNKQMQEWQKQFDGKPFGFDQKEMDQLKRQMEEMQSLGLDHMV
jgi:hypothetical protein